MKSKDNLFTLIKAMSPTEISYLKKYTRIYSIQHKPNYLLVFEEIRKQENYDESLLLERFKAERFAKNFAVAKKDLKDKILEALSHYYNGRNKFSKLQKMLVTFPILYEKKQYPLLRQLLNAARKIALKENEHPMLLEIISWERKLIFQIAAKRRMELLENLEQESTDLVSKINKQQRLESHYYKLVDLLNNNLMLRHPTKYKQFMNKTKEDLAIINSKELPHHLQVLYLKTLGLTKYASNEMEEAVLIYEDLLHLVESGPTFKDRPSLYKKALCDYLNAACKARQMERIPPVLEKIHAMPATSDQEDADIFNISSFMGLLYFLNVKEMGRARKLIGYIEKHWPKYQNFIKTGRQITFFYNILVFYFLNREWAAAAPWVERILRQGTSLERKDIQGAVRILQLVIFYELKDWDSLANRLASGRRTLKKNEQIMVFESTVLQHFQARMECSSAEESKGLREKLKDALEALKKNQAEQNALGLEEMLIWLD